MVATVTVTVTLTVRVTVTVTGCHCILLGVTVSESGIGPSDTVTVTGLTGPGGPRDRHYLGPLASPSQLRRCVALRARVTVMSGQGPRVTVAVSVTVPADGPSHSLQPGTPSHWPGPSDSEAAAAGDSDSHDGRWSLTHDRRRHQAS
jgi:hypothetical protein